MKKTLKETIKEFKRLTTEATTTSSSGAYEQPLGYTPKHVCTAGCPNPCPQSAPKLVGSEISYDAPTVDVVDVTTTVPTVDVVDTTTTASIPTIDSTPEGWDEVAFDFDFNQGEEESMGDYFDEVEVEDEEEDGVFTSLHMFTETTKGIGW